MFWLLAQQAPDAAPLSRGYDITAWVLIGIALLAFALTAWRDVFHIFFRAKDLGTGLSRIWAVARTAIFEAWSARIWIVPLLWLVAILVINALVVPYDEATDTVALKAAVCLYGQSFMVLVVMLVLACFSIARERERRTIITTGAKPLSRLEFFLGKIVGFSAISLALLLFMGVVTYGYLLVVERNVRTTAAEKYRIEEEHFQKSQRGMAGGGGEAVNPPSQALKNIADSGVLVARNLIAPAEFQIAGLIQHNPDGTTVRSLRGGASSSERMILRFPTFYSHGSLFPTYHFIFPAYTLRNGPNPGDPPVFAPLRPGTKISIRIVISPTTGTGQERTVDHTLEMFETAEVPGLYYAQYTPEIPQLYIPDDHPELQLPIQVQVSCLTSGVYLGVWECANADNSNVIIDQFAPDIGTHGYIPLKPPQIVGFEKYDKQQVAGPSDGYEPRSGRFNDGEVASFRFSAQDMKRVPRDKDQNAVLSMYLDVDKTSNYNLQTLVDVDVYNQLGRPPTRVSNVAVNEKILTEVTLPMKDVSDTSDTFVDIRCAIPGHWVAVVRDSVRFELSSTPFLINLVKSELVIFFSAVLLITVAVVASVRVNGWVAILVTATAYFLGNGISQIQYLLTSGADSLLAPGEARQYQSQLVFKALGFLQVLAIKAVYVICLLLPDFRLFDSTTDILQYRNMPWLELGRDMLWMGLFAIPPIAVGYLMIRKQELA